MKTGETAERTRLEESRDDAQPWKKWGPYLSERQWGTVREDYSDDGDAWAYFTHDQARSRAYRWGEDGIAGISDEHQILCFSLGMWNGKDAILKERLFGLTNAEGNHGEDVKEYYFYLDNTPTHSYMKYLYKYCQQPFPYTDLIERNRERSRDAFEYELIDTGVFDDDEYFDVFIEYAKASVDDILIKISVYNRSDKEASIDLLPTLLFRNTWCREDSSGIKPVIKASKRSGYSAAVTHQTYAPEDRKLDDFYFSCDRDVPLLFTENETNNARIFGTQNATKYVKDGINDFVVSGDKDAVNFEQGTKVSPHYKLTIPAGGCEIVRLRLSTTDHKKPMEDFDDIFLKRKVEADEFYLSIAPEKLRNDEQRFNVFRQALSGMLWSKQFFHYDVHLWLQEHNVTPMIHCDRKVRNKEWFHIYNDDIISMPDKWEYPWYAAWDLAFHTAPFYLIDPDFVKSQLDMMLRSNYIHPNGQMPAYEWNFGDVNPPVHAFATYNAYLFDRERNNGEGDLEFLKYTFSKLLINFTWWLNRKDPRGHNVFEGGFLGLDNIGVFNRSKALPTGGHLEQADGTAWMVFFSQQMLNIAVELAQHVPLYERFALKFFEHTVWIAAAMDRPGVHRDELWNEEDGFFYDVLRLPDGQAMQLKVRSMVGLLPLCSVVVFEDESFSHIPTFKDRAMRFVERQKAICSNMHLPIEQGHLGRRMLAVCDETKLRKILKRVFDENEFLSPHGIRSLSKYHQDNPYIFHYGNEEFRVDYIPAESNTPMFGGNSNWRGPIWFPVNYLILRSLLMYYSYYGDDFKIEYPTGSGKEHTLFEIIQDLMERMISIFLPDKHGKRPTFGGCEKFQNDPHWRDYILFYEYFHGDNGAGLGASHQTGWTGVVAMLLHFQAAMTKETWLQSKAPMRKLASMVLQK